MLQSYLPVIVFVGLGVVVGGTFTMLNKVLGPSRPSRVKSEPYECGLPTEVTRTFRFGISFYMVAMLFILFDVEAVFMLPWAVVYKQLPVITHSRFFGFWEMLVYLGFVAVGLFYVWKKGVLNWSNDKADL